jgi:hypothetical protein
MDMNLDLRIRLHRQFNNTFLAPSSTSLMKVRLQSITTDKVQLTEK